jgi:enoyl-CoA hydratase
MPDAGDSPTDTRPAMFTVQRREDGVALITMSRPDKNALATWGLSQLQRIAEDLIRTPPGAVVIWGGPDVFSTGGDPAEFSHFDSDVGRYVSERFHAAFAAVAAIPRPTIAAITGVASGGGLELALACDFRVAAEDSRLGQHEITIGMFPGGGGTQRLPRLIGVSRAKELIFLGELVASSDALAIGLVNRVVPTGTVLQQALDWAAEFATGPTRARGLAKRVIDEGMLGSLSTGLDVELSVFPELFAEAPPKADQPTERIV